MLQEVPEVVDLTKSLEQSHLTKVWSLYIAFFVD